MLLESGNFFTVLVARGRSCKRRLGKLLSHLKEELRAMRCEISPKDDCVSTRSFLATCVPLSALPKPHTFHVRSASPANTDEQQLSSRAAADAPDRRALYIGDSARVNQIGQFPS